MNEREIFAKALDISDRAERNAFLLEACGRDAGLRGHLEQLLKTQENLGSFLGIPATLPRDAFVGISLTESPGDRIGPYKLLESIGEGGMGIVYMAEQQDPVQRKVALKIIKPGLDSRQVLARFEAERQALAMMDHPNIARVLDVGALDEADNQHSEATRQNDGTLQARIEATGTISPSAAFLPQPSRPYFVMELVYGVPITLFCDQRRLNARQRLELLVPVCQAIQHAHQKGVIHRDIKPSNVLVTMQGDQATPKVIDFGVAKATEQRLTERTIFTQVGALVGTFEYMSPEQAEMNSPGVDTRSDIYSLGVLLYELLTGTTPIDSKRLREAPLDEAMRIIREEEPPRPSIRIIRISDLPATTRARRADPARLARTFRGEIDWIVMKCLEKDRSRRYETASALASDLLRFLRDEPVEACPPSAGYRLRKFARKRWAAIVTALGFAALLLAGTVVSVWQLARATRAEREALAARDTAALYRELLLNDPKLRGLPIDHPDRATAFIILGQVLLRTGRPVEAELVLRECLEIREKKLPLDFRTYNACSLFGASLLAQHKYAEAEPLLLRAHEGMARIKDRIPSTSLVHPVEVLEWLLLLYQQWGKPAQVARWRRQLEDRADFRP
jgi:eukaryotic-like serine/threonine-protein kinase